MNKKILFAIVGLGLILTIVFFHKRLSGTLYILILGAGSLLFYFAISNNNDKK